MLKSLTGALALVALTGAGALAADLPSGSAYPSPVYAPASAFTWSGFYAGANLGYGFATYTKSPYFGSTSAFALGVTGGYNYQSGNLVVGLEGDLDWTGLNDKRSFTGPMTSKASTSSLMTIRGRLGYAMGNVLLYGTAGYAGANVKAQLFDATIPAVYNSTRWHNGYALGAGLEYAFTPQISAKAEYLYTSLGATSAFAGPHASSIGLHDSLVRAGVNYHF